MKLSVTRAIIDAIHSGELARVETKTDPVFQLAIPAGCPGVAADILWPRSTWKDAAAYDTAAQKLAGLFRENFKKYAASASSEVRSAAL